MSEKFDPYLKNVEPLTKDEVEEHLKSLPIVYFGETPPDSNPSLRQNFPPIEIIDENGEKYPYSVLISGDPSAAKKILIKGMSWSDHPGRGFEALREAMIADPKDELAVIGVSFPGAGLNSPRMTKLQKKSLEGKEGDFSYIGKQQWQAIISALLHENSLRLQNGAAQAGNLPLKKFNLSNYEFIISGSSQGASNGVGMLQAVPEGVRVSAIGLAEETDLDVRGRGRFIWDYIRHGGDNFDKYTEVNPYNEIAELGPSHNPFLNAVRRPEAHLTSVVNSMANGGALDRIIYALKAKELEGIFVDFRAGSEDRVASSLERLKQAKKFQDLGKIAVVKTVVHPGHYHPYLENLANAQHEFRSFVP
jgi:hypothetical protein